ncbi:MAG: hypothetical protein ABSH00_05990 [Bryobacteraceae bacterium]|jgi:hypothetical protein
MTAGHQQAAGRLDRALAGLQAGTVGVLNMLFWLGVCSVWRREDFWTGPNLLAGAFYPAAAFYTGSVWNTAFGVSLYILLYGVLGMLFALAVGRPMARLRLALVAMAFGLGWYWIAYRWLWQAALPLAALLHGGRAAVLGHLLYGALLGRFPRYLPAAAAPETAPPIAEQKAAVNAGTPAG